MSARNFLGITLVDNASTEKKNYNEYDYVCF